MAKNLLKVIHILEGLQQAEHLRMLNVGLQSTRIGDWQGKTKTLTVLFGWEAVVHHEYTPQAKQLVRSTTSMFFIG